MANNPYEFAAYGPFKTKEKAGTLGINILPSVSGEVDPSMIFQRTGIDRPDELPQRARNIPSAGVVVTSSARRIIELSKGGDKVGRIVVAGDGEPTEHPGFAEISRNLRDLRDKWFPRAKLVLLSRATNLEKAETRRVMRIYDRPVVRFEWGTAKTFTSLSGHPGPELKSLQAALASLDKLVVQASFRKTGAVDNSSETEVRNWLKRLVEIAPDEVEITAPPKRSKTVLPATPSRLEKIAAQVGEQLEELTVKVMADAVPHT